MTYLMRVLRSPSTYPLATFYAVAMIVVPLTVANVLRVDISLILLTCVAVVLILVANRRLSMVLRDEISQVHTLVNSQHTDLVERVTQLIDALKEGGVAVPEPKKDGTP